MTIKRYRMMRDPWNHAHMTARDDGEFVLHEDLTAIERATYERGVRDAAEAVPVNQYPGSWIAPMLSAARDRILALLTQEGR